MKKTLILPFLLLSFLIAPSAEACSPAPGWPPSAAENAASKDAVFIGTVKSIIQDKSAFGEYRITFAVEEAYKGALENEVTVRTQSSSAACGYDNGYETFKEGTVWAIYADGSATEGYQTDHLSLNTKYDSVGDAAAALEKLGITKQPMVCTMEYAPVCGKTKDGTIKTYGNACMLRAAEATLLYPGECRTPGSVPDQDLSFGARDEGVTWLQQYLIDGSVGAAARALADVGATGYFGRLTRAALAEFQAANAIAPARGYFGRITRGAIEAKLAQEDESETFTGEITAVDTSCFADAVCSVTVGGKKIILLTGMRVAPLPPVGSLQGVDSIGDLEGKIGSQAEVRAVSSDEESYDYTLYGSKSYYVKVLK